MTRPGAGKRSPGDYLAVENRVMDLFEAGERRGAIAEAVGLSAVTVNSIIEYMRVGRTDAAQSPAAIRAQTGRLLAAIGRVYPDRVAQ